MPRDGYKVQFGMTALYESLGLKRASDTSAQFLQKYLPAWVGNTKRLKLGDPYLRSQQYSNNVKQHGEDANRVVDMITSNAVGLIALCLKWHCKKPGGGGLTNDEERRRVGSFLERLLAVTHHDGEATFTLETSNVYSYDSTAEKKDPATIKVLSTGVVDFSCLKEEVRVTDVTQQIGCVENAMIQTLCRFTLCDGPSSIRV